ncbi:MAG: phosphatase PAP2 family protein [Burkholderiaceae bacterium]|nr:phosphatase PAP2 family protein [Burkholderiaceae bacterium]
METIYTVVPRRSGPLWREQPLTFCLLFLSVIVLWEISGLDLVFAEFFGNARGFRWRNYWVFENLLHEGGRFLSWMFILCLCAGVWWPFGILCRLNFSKRLQLAVTPLIAVSVINALKAISTTSCPWDLQIFGGAYQYVSHWVSWGIGWSGNGHCFPAGHASAGFAFLSGIYTFSQWPRIAKLWLLVVLITGFIFGFAQQIRGAHFMSHTLWSLWICWTVAWLTDRLWSE